LVVALAGLALAMCVAPAAAQSSAPPEPLRVVASFPALDSPQIFEVDYRYRRPVFRLGYDYHLREGEEARHVVLVWGSATIDGRVRDDVVVVFGDVRVGRTAVIDGSVVAVAGAVNVDQGATVRRDIVVVGGAMEAPTGFWPGGEQVIIGPPIIGDRMRSVVPWITRGLLWGRPLVPDLGWVWAVFGVVFLLSLAVNHVFDAPVGRSADLIRMRPLASFLTGMLVLVLAGPLLVILTATVVGILVIPFALCAAFVVWFIGKVGVVRAMGGGVVRGGDPQTPFYAFRAFVIGFAILTVAYLIPVVGLLVWALVTVFGLGAGTLMITAALRREYPGRAKAPGAEPPPMPPPPPPPGPSGPPSERGPEFTPGPAGSAAYASSTSMPEAASAVEPPPVAFTAPTAAETPASQVSAAGVLPSDLRQFPRATFLDRVAAFALDCVLVAIVLQLFRVMDDDGTFPLALLVYHMAFWAWKGTTLGGIVVGVRLVRAGGGALRFADALVRSLASVFSVAALGIGCFWMLYDDERQMWHDKIAGTYAVKVPRDYPVD
jgi:uncharacterized RDD family membrane protein YckC